MNVEGMGDNITIQSRAWTTSTKKKKNMKKETKRKMEENEFWDNRVIFGGGKRDEKFNQTFYIQHFY